VGHEKEKELQRALEATAAHAGLVGADVEDVVQETHLVLLERQRAGVDLRSEVAYGRRTTKNLSVKEREVHARRDLRFDPEQLPADEPLALEQLEELLHLDAALQQFTDGDDHTPRGRTYAVVPSLQAVDGSLLLTKLRFVLKVFERLERSARERLRYRDRLIERVNEALQRAGWRLASPEELATSECVSSVGTTAGGRPIHPIAWLGVGILQRLIPGIDRAEALRAARSAERAVYGRGGAGGGDPDELGICTYEMEPAPGEEADWEVRPIAAGLKQIQGPSGGQMTLTGDPARNIHMKIAAEDGRGGLCSGVVSNAHLRRRDQLDKAQQQRIEALGWRLTRRAREGYQRRLEASTDRERLDLAADVVRVFEVYGCSAEEIELEWECWC